MSGFLGNVGFLAIGFVIICGYGKILDYYDLKRTNLFVSDKVYAAADKFAKGASFEEVKAILTGSYEIDEEDAKEIIAQSLPHRKDRDGGYRAFIKSVSKILDENI